MAPGFLTVFSEPGEQVPLEEFHDWYNNEHIPLRLDSLSSFLTAARLSALDSKKPSWVAMYDITETSVFSHESYTRLGANRSDREKGVIARLELLDRRTCEVLSDSGENLTKSCSWKAGENPTTVAITHGLELGDVDAVKAWAKDAASRLSALQPLEWVRTKSCRTFDSLRSGLSVEEGPEGQKVPQFIVVHEFTSPALLSLDEYKRIVPLDAAVVDHRSWKLYRAYPTIAQGNKAAV